MSHKRTTYTSVDVLEMLVELARKHGSQAAAAASIGVTAQYYGQVMNGARTPGPAILSALGLRTVYARDDERESVGA